MGRLLIDPSMPTGPKFVDAPDAAKLLHFLALCHAAHNLTDGFISESVARHLTKFRRSTVDEALAYLTAVQPNCSSSAWEMSEKGYFLHDYDDPLYGNPMRADAIDRRELKIKAGIAGGKASAQARLKKYGTAQPSNSAPEAEPEAPASKAASKARKTTPEARPEAPASTSASTAQTVENPEAPEAPRSTPARAREAGAHAQPFPSPPLTDTDVHADHKDVSTEHGDIALQVPANGHAGDRPGDQPLSTQAVKLVDWLLVNRGDHTFTTRAEQVHELGVASQMLRLGLPYTEVLALLKGYRSAVDQDDVPSSLGFYYGKLQDDIHERLKSAPRARAGSGDLSRITPTVPGRKGSA